MQQTSLVYCLAQIFFIYLKQLEKKGNKLACKTNETGRDPGAWRNHFFAFIAIYFVNKLWSRGHVFTVSRENQTAHCLLTQPSCDPVFRKVFGSAHMITYKVLRWKTCASVPSIQELVEQSFSRYGLPARESLKGPKYKHLKPRLNI